MRSPLITKLVLMAFIASMAATPAYGQSFALPAAQAVAQGSQGDPLALAVTLSAGGGPVGVGIAVGVVAVTVAVTHWDDVKSGWDSVRNGLSKLFGGGDDAKERGERAAARADAERREMRRQREAYGAKVEAERMAAVERGRAEQYSRELADTFKQTQAVAQAAAADLAGLAARSAPALRSLVSQAERLHTQVHQQVRQMETVHNAQVRDVATAVNDGIATVRSQAAEGFNPDRAPPPLPQEDGDQAQPPPPSQFGQRSNSDLITQPGEPGYADLVTAEHYLRSAANSLTANTPHAMESASHLALANMAFDEADARFAEGQIGIGNSILEYVGYATDDVFSYESMRDRVSEGSTFLAGMISGASGGVLSGRPLEGYERAWAVGQLVGGGLGLIGNTGAAAGMIAANLGTGGLAVASGGVLAPLAAAVAGESAVVATASIGLGTGQIAQMKAGWEELTKPVRVESSGEGPGGGANEKVPETSVGAEGAAPASRAPAVSNAIKHIFGKEAHNLGGLVAEFGSREAAYDALYGATNAAVKAQGTRGIFEMVVKVGEQAVTVRGNVLNGVLRVNTAYIPGVGL